MDSDIDRRFTGCHRLGGTISVITGAGSGIGRGSALRFAREGATVACLDRDLASAQATADMIRAAGGRAEAHAVDVASTDQVAQAVRTIEADIGPIDSLMNCAGLVRSGTASDISAEDWNLTLQVNLTGTWLMCQAVLGPMVKRRRGSIINIASVGALVATPANTAYLVSKAGVAMLTKSIALDYGTYGIRCNAVCPGTVMTPLVAGHWLGRGEAQADDMEAALEKARGRYPIGRLGEVEEIGALATYLASDESGFTTGAVIPVDGGLSVAAWLPGH